MAQDFTNLDTQWLRNMVCSELHNLSTYFDHLNEYIQKSEAQEVKDIIIRSGESEAELSQEFWTYNYPAHWEDILGERLRSSVPILGCTIAEFHLRIACIYACRHFDIHHSWKEPRQGITEEAKKYLRTKASILQPDEDTWEMLLCHYTVRNCIVHNAGHVIAMHHAKKLQLQRFVETTNGLQIDQNYLCVSTDYCTQFIQFLTTFFHHLYDGFMVRAGIGTLNESLSLPHQQS